MMRPVMNSYNLYCELDMNLTLKDNCSTKYLRCFHRAHSRKEMRKLFPTLYKELFISLIRNLILTLPFMRP